MNRFLSVFLCLTVLLIAIFTLFACVDNGGDNYEKATDTVSEEQSAQEEEITDSESVESGDVSETESESETETESESESESETETEKQPQGDSIFDNAGTDPDASFNEEIIKPR